MNRTLTRLLTAMLLAAVWIKCGISCRAETINDSPYVSLSPDGEAWTTDSGETDYTWYQEGTTVYSGISSSLPQPVEGEHYYRVLRSGRLAVGKWVVVHRTGICTHDSYPSGLGEWHGIAYGRSPCFRYYYSGWNAYCADCGEKISDMLFYMSEAAAASISYLEVGGNKAYYYLCPWCDNLEQGRTIGRHECKAVSANQYKVHYDVNTIQTNFGYMADSRHMYNNAEEYEGSPVTPVMRLSKNRYVRPGYEFDGWNTMPDGSGVSYEDEEKILNLTSADCNIDSKKGTVVLYAMWRASESTLVIDPSGGEYAGNKEKTYITNTFYSQYIVDEEKLKAPDGHTVSFETYGAGQLSPVTGEMHFSGWTEQDPFEGSFDGVIYRFTASDGNIDTIKANYAADSIVLPNISREGCSFGGWYYDEGFELPAGGAGDELIPAYDMTLYAQWVELKLYAENNLSDNDGRGAVDLEWSQEDNKEKSYRLYQRSEYEDEWKLISTAADIGNDMSLRMQYTFSGKKQIYTVPYTGFYIITASGAQGGGYDKFSGGEGGTVRARLWLYSGERVTLTIGGSDGYNGGGSGGMFANGGGCTVISTERSGVILVAGGGGGASVMGDGKPGGKADRILSTGICGEDGEAGGGGGYYGGKAGRLIIHSHTQSCYEDISVDILSEYAAKAASWSYYYEDGDDEYPMRVISYGLGEEQQYRQAFIDMENEGFPLTIIPQNQIPTDGAEAVRLEVCQNCTSGKGYSGNYIENGGIAIYNQDGERIYCSINRGSEKYVVSRWQDYDSDGNEGDWGVEWGPVDNPGLYHMTYNNSDQLISSYSNLSFDPGYDETIARAARIFGGTTYADLNPDFFGSRVYYIIEDIELPAGTTAITVVSEMPAVDVREHAFYTLRLEGGKRLTCGYTEGQVLSSEPAYGGSSYINTGCADYYTESSGGGIGDGYAEIVSDEVGFLNILSLKGVSAPDLNAPEAVDTGTVEIIAPDAENVKIVWSAPKDIGTTYYHMAESYIAESTELLCSSNITSNTIVTGVKGYYIVLDERDELEVSEYKGEFCDEEYTVVSVKKNTEYLHIAAVDYAGNVGKTVHIKINPYTDIPWQVCTVKLSLEEGENVYSGAVGQDNNVFYVRSDGITPFMVNYEAYILGRASEVYQINYAVFESECGENIGKNQVVCSNTAVSEEITLNSDEIYTECDGDTLLSDYPYTRAQRLDGCRRLSVKHKFTISYDDGGKGIIVTPRAGVEKNGQIIFSDYEADLENGLVIIGDGEAPIVSGMEALENIALIDRDEGNVLIKLNAADMLSGLRSFEISVINSDNACERKWESDEDGSIYLDITEDEPIFSGDFIIYISAEDNVGNKCEYSFGATEFALHTDVERILEPHEPVFQSGESGILRISTWGYADKVEVEFPDELTALNPELNICIDYTDLPGYRHDEALQFMIPLYTPENRSYEITVRAYKGDKMLEEHPRISVVGVEGTVLDDFRTRLR